MGRFEVYLELGEEGGCMAHVLDLPGCYVAAADRKAALERLPEAIVVYHQDLIRHGQRVSMPEQIELKVMEVQSHPGVFHPDERSALFEAERRGMTQKDVADYLRLASFNREDLLTLVRGMADNILDWRADAESMSIRRILDHVARSEQWYISRLYAEPSVVGDPKLLSVRRFLALVRDDASQRFMALDDDELNQVRNPPDGSGDTTEAWTTRKALRRLLEHEREHIGHIGENLERWRQHLLARLAASRSSFIWQLVSLDASALVDSALFVGDGESGWTLKDLLLHLADWDMIYARRATLASRGRVASIEQVDVEERNAVLTESRAEWTLDEAVSNFATSRERFLVAIGGVSDAGLHRLLRLPWGQRSSLAGWARRRSRHDERHTIDVLAWRGRVKPAPMVGPKSILQAALESGRQEMLATSALIRASQWETRPVCGVWTLKDVLGHVADWEWYGVEKLDGPPSQRSLDIRFRGSIQAWNEAHAAARQDQPWEQVWADFQGARLALGRILESMSQDDLSAPFAVAWSKDWTAYRWFQLWLHHEREHAADLRANIALPGWPARLKQFS